VGLVEDYRAGYYGQEVALYRERVGQNSRHRRGGRPGYPGDLTKVINDLAGRLKCLGGK
jgi:hypothetical protein